MSNSILIKSSDGKTFEVDKEIAALSQTLKDVIEDVSADTVTLPNVTGDVFSKVLEYSIKYIESLKEESKADVKDGVVEMSTVLNSVKVDGEEVQNWDKEFLKDFDYPELFALLLAANYLNIKTLLDLTTQEVAERIQDKSVEEVRKIFNIENDFTQEEEEKMRKENPWAYEV